MAEAEIDDPVTAPSNPKIPMRAIVADALKTLAEFRIESHCDEVLGPDKNDAGYDQLYWSLLNVALPCTPEDLSLPASAVKPASKVNQAA